MPEDFAFFEDECGVPSGDLGEMQELCEQFYDVFIDDFVENFVDCLTAQDCDDFGDDDAGPDGGADGGPGEDLFDVCMGLAAVETEPEEANLDLRDHLCQWMVACEGGMTQEECEAGLWDGELMLFKIIGEPYVSDLDDCVVLPPECTDDIEGCIDGVLSEIGLFEE